MILEQCTKYREPTKQVLLRRKHPSESQGCGEQGVAVHRKWRCGFQIKGRNNAVCDFQVCYRVSGRSGNIAGYIHILVHSKYLARALPTTIY